MLLLTASVRVCLLQVNQTCVNDLQAGIADAIRSVPFGRWDLELSESMMPSGQLTARFGLLADVSTRYCLLWHVSD